MLQFKSGESSLHWQQLVEGRMEERVQYQTRTDKSAEKHKIATEIDAMKLNWEEKCKVWKERTELSPAAFESREEAQGVRLSL